MRQRRRKMMTSPADMGIRLHKKERVSVFAKAPHEPEGDLLKHIIGICHIDYGYTCIAQRHDYGTNTRNVTAIR